MAVVSLMTLILSNNEVFAIYGIAIAKSPYINFEKHHRLNVHVGPELSQKIKKTSTDDVGLERKFLRRKL